MNRLPWKCCMALGALLIAAHPCVAAAVDDPPAAAVARGQRLALFVGVGYLGGPGGSGAAIATGVRYRPLGPLALSLDAGYGLLGAAGALQDRWWVIPSIAVVVATGPGGRLRFDLGVGAGVGTATGYVSGTALLADRTVWAVQAVPALRAHAVAAVALGRGVELFARLDATALLLEGNSLGARDGDVPLRGSDATWLHLSLGARLGLL